MEYEKLMRNLYKKVRDHSKLSPDELIEAAEYGANGGYSNFIYYKDTDKFFGDCEDLILELSAMQSDENNMTILGFWEAFCGCEDIRSMEYLRQRLSWYAVEEVGHWIRNKREENKPKEVIK